MPGSEAIHDSEKLLVVDVVVPLRRLHGAGVEGDRAEGAVGLRLREDAGNRVVGRVGFEDGGKGGIEVYEDRCIGESVFEESEGRVGVGRPGEGSVFTS